MREVLGLRPVPRKPITNVIDTPGVATHKFLPGRPVALEALLDQLGILLQRIISLEFPLRCKGDRFPQLRKAANLGLPLMERKLQVKCSLYLPAGGQQSEQP